MTKSGVKQRLNFQEISIHDLLMEHKALNAKLALFDNTICTDMSHNNEVVGKERKLLCKQNELLYAAFQCSLSKPESVMAILELWWREEISAAKESDIHFSQRLIENIKDYYKKEVSI